ncbi:hypothetical protein Tco_0869658 [Tanacetum coccineum]
MRLFRDVGFVDENVMMGIAGSPPSPNYIPDSEEPQSTPQLSHWDVNELSVEEQPLPPVDSPTAESPGYVTKSDPEEDLEEYKDDETEDGPVDYPMDGGEDGDDDDGDSSGDSLFIPPPFTDITTTGARITVQLQASISLPLETKDNRITFTQALVDAVTAALPSPPLPPLPPSLYIPPPFDRRDDILESERPPRKRSCLFALGSRYEVREISTARPTRGRGVDYGIVGLALAQRVTIDSQWVDLLMGDRMILGGGNSLWMGGGLCMLTEWLAHGDWIESGGHFMSSDTPVHETRSQMQQAEMVELRETDRRHQAQMIETLFWVMRDIRREMGDMQAESLALREQ